MAIPVINTTTSVLGYRQWLTWQFQLAATNMIVASGYSWACTGLPPGMALNAGTGLISGAGTTPGVYNVTATATNPDGASVPLIFPIGIEESASMVNASMGLVFDIISGLVSSDLIAGAGRNDKGELTPILYVKENDDYLLIVRCEKAATSIDMNLSSLKIGLKEFEPDSLITIGGGETESTDFKKFGSGANAYWVLPVKFESAALKSALVDWEDDKGTQFNALAEIEFVEAAGVDGHNWAGIGPDTLRRTSRTFAINIERDLIQES